MSEQDIKTKLQNSLKKAEFIKNRTDNIRSAAKDGVDSVESASGDDSRSVEEYIDSQILEKIQETSDAAEKLGDAAEDTVHSTASMIKDFRDSKPAESSEQQTAKDSFRRNKAKEKLKSEKRVHDSFGSYYDFDENGSTADSQQVQKEYGSEKLSAQRRHTERLTVSQAEKTQQQRAARAREKPSLSEKHNSRMNMLQSQSARRAAQAGEKATQKTAHTAEKQSTKAANKTGKKAGRASEKTAQTIEKTAKYIAEKVKDFFSHLGKGGWIAVLIILAAVLLIAVGESVFGIFTNCGGGSGEDETEGMTVQSVVQEINAEYHDRILQIKSSVRYDELEMSGSRTVWPEVLSVYAVKINTDNDDPQEVATMDEKKKVILTEIFWEMNQIESSTEERTETVIHQIEDGHGNIIEVEEEITHTVLFITVSHITAEEMADKYNFSEEQREYLEMLLDESTVPLWSYVLYGSADADEQIVNVALSQIGNIGGEQYWSWYGCSSRIKWCACFVSWCANECGYIDRGIIPKFAACANGVQWFKERNLWVESDGIFEPSPGMIIFFDFDNEGVSHHTGIVEKTEDGRVWTVEGNSDDQVKERSYDLGYDKIMGYGTPEY